MPQLDVTTYFSQLFWLGLTYMSFYLLLTKYSLPLITKILYTRQYKALQASATHASPLHGEAVSKHEQTLAQVTEACGQAKNACVQAMNKSHTWLVQASHSVQQHQLHKVQHTYAMHMQQANTDLAITNMALKYTMNPAAQHACNMTKPKNTHKKKVFQKAMLATLFATHGKAVR